MAENRRAYLDAQHRIVIRREPIPRPGPGEALVAIKANGICGSDIHFFHEGRLGNFLVTRPYVPGHEACGEVAEVGDGAADPRADIGMGGHILQAIATSSMKQSYHEPKHHQTLPPTARSQAPKPQSSANSHVLG